MNTILQQIIEHAQYAAPNECCGVITVNGAVRCVNTARDTTTHAEISIHELQRISKRNRVLGFYHSHVNANARPSPTDLEHAMYFDMLYIIVNVSMHNGGYATELAFYALRGTPENKSFEELKWPTT